MTGPQAKAIPWTGLTALRAVATLLVLFVHSPLYTPTVVRFASPLNVAVFLFVFAQAYAVFARLQSGDRTVLTFYAWPAVRRMLCRIVLPWFALVLLFAVIGFRYEHSTEYFWNCAAFGPGSYYLMLYLMLYFLLPVVFCALSGLGRRALPVGVAAVVVLECTAPLLLDLSRHAALIYRSLPLRYLGAVVFAYAAVSWHARGFGRSARLWLGAAAFCSLAVALFRSMFPETGFPPAPQDYGWWICHVWYAPYPALLALAVLRIRNLPVALTWVGRHSWPIFLLQMFVYACFSMS